MADINKVIVVGNLTRDAELKYVSNEIPLLKFSVANNQRVKRGGEWSEEAHFFDCALWGKRAESIQGYMVKGKRVAIEGTLVQNRWTTDDGQNRSKVEIKISDINLFSRGDATPGQAAPTEGADDDVPF